jgi:hypothetical protein
MSIIFSEDLARAVVYPVPDRTTAISYIYTPDRLLIAAHLKDKWATINVKTSEDEDALDEFWVENCAYCTFLDGGRCASVVARGLDSDTICPMDLVVPDVVEEVVGFTSAQTIFEIYLDIADKKDIFTHRDRAKAILRGTKVVDDKILVTETARWPSNVHDSYNICWGLQSQPDNLRGIANLFFSSEFNGDLTSVYQFEENCTAIRRDVSAGEFITSRYTFITGSADALLMIHSGVHLGAFFQMTAAGFKPISECSSIIMIPLKTVEIEHEGETYRGYKTPYDSCRKRWFVSTTGELVGQL